MKATCCLTPFIEVSRTDISTKIESRVGAALAMERHRETGIDLFWRQGQSELGCGERHEDSEALMGSL